MDLWHRCTEHLEQVLSPQQYNTWIRPLQIIEDDKLLRLLAPNRFVLDWVR
ncbi:MAG: chromosomal replication initiator protein DnaA, partial [Candidatus Thiodiazotropha taylori]|nr:chromosomal replication initiator protein DnaA [Candidatus Thiodiazotropha taylori]